MNKPVFLTSRTVFSEVFRFCDEFTPQESEASKVEIGAAFSSLSPCEPALKRGVGLGCRLTHHITIHIAFEAEAIFFPSGSACGFTPDGSILQSQFGLKTGERREKSGVFEMRPARRSMLRCSA